MYGTVFFKVLIALSHLLNYDVSYLEAYLSLKDLNACALYLYCIEKKKTSLLK